MRSKAGSKGQAVEPTVERKGRRMQGQQLIGKARMGWDVMWSTSSSAKQTKGRHRERERERDHPHSQADQEVQGAGGRVCCWHCLLNHPISCPLSCAVLSCAVSVDQPVACSEALPYLPPAAPAAAGALMLRSSSFCTAQRVLALWRSLACSSSSRGVVRMLITPAWPTTEGRLR